MLTFGYTPEVFTTLDSPTIRSLDVLGATNDREGHGSLQETGVLRSGLVVGINGGLIDTDPLRVNDIANLSSVIVSTISSHQTWKGDRRK